MRTFKKDLGHLEVVFILDMQKVNNSILYSPQAEREMIDTYKFFCLYIKVAA